MIQTPQKTVYQYFVDGRDYKNGIYYTGCFRTYEEADAWRTELNAIGAREGSIGGRHGLSPYGKWESHFNVDAYFKKLKDWLGDYEITGRD